MSGYVRICQDLSGSVRIDGAETGDCADDQGCGMAIPQYDAIGACTETDFVMANKLMRSAYFTHIKK
jgi:hypothetical protein